MSTQTDLEEVLEGLVGISHDVETAFTVCAHATRNPALGAVLSKHALVCGGAARSLSSMVCGLRHDGCRGREYSRKPDWLALHDAMARRDDAALRDECIRTEDETLMRFRDALDQHLSGVFSGSCTDTLRPCLTATVICNPLKRIANVETGRIAICCTTPR